MTYAAKQGYKLTKSDKLVLFFAAALVIVIIVLLNSDDSSGPIDTSTVDDTPAPQSNVAPYLKTEAELEAEARLR